MECNLCRKTFKTYSEHQVHIKLKHKSARVRCSKCSKTFLWQHHLDEHLETHGNDQNDQIQFKNSDEKIQSCSKEIQSFKCDFCEKSYLRLSNFHKHVKTKHTNKASKVYFQFEFILSIEVTKSYLEHNFHHQIS